MMISKESIKEADTIVLLISGGIGRNLMSTAVVRNIKKAYPDKDIVVLAGCPDIFLRNPYVKKILNHGQPVYFYEDYIKAKKTVVLTVEPYQHFDYVYKKKHFVECWCEMLDIPCDSVYPEIFFGETEQRMAELYCEKFDKDMVLLQHCGGKVPEDKSEKQKIISKSGMYKRNLKEQTIQEIVDGLINRGYMVGSVQADTQFCPSMADKINFPIRAIIALIPYVAEVICVDSFLMHGTAVFKKKSLAIWGGTSPKVLGYEHNVNLTREVCDTPMCHRPNSYLFDIEPTGYMWDCPHNDKCMDYSSDEILMAFDKMTGGKGGRSKEERDATRKDTSPKPRAVNSPKRTVDANTGKVIVETEGLDRGGECPGEKVSAGNGADCPCGRDTQVEAR